MPYARSRQTPRRGYAGRSTRGYPSRAGTANRGYQRTGVRRMAGPPAALYPRVPTNATALKSCDVANTVVVLNSSGSSSVLVVPRLGAAFFNRLGNRTRGVSLQLRGGVQPTFSNAAAHTQGRVRIIVYYDRQPNGANPTPSDILLDTNATGATGTEVESMININNRDRFMILRDRYIILPAIAADGVGAAVEGGVFTDPNCDSKHGFKYEEFIKLKGLESLYNSTNGGGVGDVSAGAFGLLAISDDASGSEAWTFYYNCRFKFLD